MLALSPSTGRRYNTIIKGYLLNYLLTNLNVIGLVHTEDRIDRAVDFVASVNAVLTLIIELITCVRRHKPRYSYTSRDSCQYMTSCPTVNEAYIRRR